MRTLQRLLIIVSLLALCACAQTLQKLNEGEELLTGAAPINPDTDAPWPLSKLQADQYKEYVGYILLASQEKCHRFLGSLSAAERASDVSLDFATTVFSALGTAFTPLATVHALAAAASISSGTKTAIDSDIYAKETAPLIIQQIDNTYYKELSSYVDNLKTESSVDPTIEVAKIESFHKDCTLDAALASLLAAQKTTTSQPTNSTTAPTAKDLTPGASFKATSGYEYIVVNVTGTNITYVSRAPTSATLSKPTQASITDFLKLIGAPAST